jgi:hypothetical protein
LVDRSYYALEVCSWMENKNKYETEPDRPIGVITPYEVTALND